MQSWWSLGEGSGYNGRELAMYRITCPFCLESGNFKSAFRAEKRNPRSKKQLNFETLECGNCRGYVMVLWSANSHHADLHDFLVLPWPIKLEKFPEHWPEQVGRFWLQAKRNLGDHNWDAASVMARSALQISLRDKGAQGNNLKLEIQDLAQKGVLPPIMKDWSDQVRELGNDSAHPQPSQPATDSRDAEDIVRFLDFLLQYLYTLPYQIEQYRKREHEDSEA
jgi:hypothetical protein